MEVHENDGNLTVACFLAVKPKPNVTLSNAIWEKVLERKYVNENLMFKRNAALYFLL